ncbi:MAG: hypothetical protein LAT83_09635, partial [Kiritimatiellae bacterium]|nr:hypothetical protein [Kiritimatiellia bacterium]
MNAIHKPLMGGGLHKSNSANAFVGLFLLCFSLSATAQLPPPGIFHSVDFQDSDQTELAIPFLPTESDPADAFAGQLEDSGLTLHQWDAITQTWRSATYTPGTGWSGDAITLNPGEPVLATATLAPTADSHRLSLAGLLPAVELTQPILPGLNLVGSPQPRARPLTAWDWDELGEAAASDDDADTLYTFQNTAQAWLQLDGPDAIWTGFAIPADPGVLLPGHAYFYLFRGAQSFQAEGQVVDAYDD